MHELIAESYSDPAFAESRPMKCRHSCRTLGFVAAVCLGAACSTTYHLGRLGDPGTTEALAAAAARPGVVVDLTRAPSSGGVAPLNEVRGTAPEGLMVSIGGDPPKLVGYSEVQSLRRTDRLRGARNGAIALGVPAFLAGFFLDRALAGTPACGSNCTASDNTTTASLEAGALFALVGAAVGGTIGALVGVQDRYVIDAP
jgi:hypothetical protein